MSFLTRSCLVYILYHPGNTEIEALNKPLCSVHCSRQPKKHLFDPDPLFGCHSSKSKKQQKSIYITEAFTCCKITGELDHVVKWLMERKCQKHVELLFACLNFLLIMKGVVVSGFLSVFSYLSICGGSAGFARELPLLPGFNPLTVHWSISHWAGQIRDCLPSILPHL